jgi:NADH-quinone oxidoreductase subunit G
MLPISPFSETAGTFINLEGTVQSFGPVAPTKGLSRPAWRLIAALGKLFGFTNFEYQSIEDVRAELKDHLDNLPGKLQAKFEISTIQMQRRVDTEDVIERLSDVPMYSVDSIVRRAPALQLTKEAKHDFVWVSSDLSSKLDILDQDVVRVEQGENHFDLPARVDSNLMSSVVRVPMNSQASKVIGGVTGTVQISKIQSTGAVA